MNGEARRRRHAMLTGAAPDKRSARFVRRRAGTAGPLFSDLAKLPEWLTEPDGQRERLATLAVLLRYRRALDAEISGPRLARIAAEVGEAMFDAACAAGDLPDHAGPEHLPVPGAIAAEGRALLEAGLPRSLAAAFPGARDDPAARALVARAQAIASGLA